MLFFVTTSSSSVCFTPDWTIIVALSVVKVGYEAWVTILTLQKLQIFRTHTFFPENLSKAKTELKMIEHKTSLEY